MASVETKIQTWVSSKWKPVFFPRNVSCYLLEYITDLLIPDLLSPFILCVWLPSVYRGACLKSPLVRWWLGAQILSAGSGCCTCLWFQGQRPSRQSVGFTFLYLYTNLGSKTCLEFQRRKRSRCMLLVVFRFHLSLYTCYLPCVGNKLWSLGLMVNTEPPRSDLVLGVVVPVLQVLLSTLYWVTLDEALNLSKTQFPHLKWMDALMGLLQGLNDTNRH